MDKIKSLQDSILKVKNSTLGKMAYNRLDKGFQTKIDSVLEIKTPEEAKKTLKLLKDFVVENPKLSKAVFVVLPKLKEVLDEVDKLITSFGKKKSKKSS